LCHRPAYEPRPANLSRVVTYAGNPWTSLGTPGRSATRRGGSDFAMYPMRNYPMLQDLVSAKYHLVAVVDGVPIYARNP
jgi:hypothetical protein